MQKSRKKGNGKRLKRGRNRRMRTREDGGAVSGATGGGRLLSSEHKSLLAMLWAGPRDIKGSSQYITALELQDKGLVKLTQSTCGCGSYTAKLTSQGEDIAFEALSG